MPNYSECVLVTGDVVKDIAVYKGDRLFASDPGKVNPHFKVTMGGANQLYRIIEAAVGKGQAQFAFTPLSDAGLMAFPDELAVHTLWQLQDGGLKKEHAESGKKDKPLKVWRVADPLGYALNPLGKPNPVPLQKAEIDLQNPPAILVIDDADLGFRSIRTREAGLWPLGVMRIDEYQPKWIIHKMSHLVAQGDLWRELIYFTGNGNNPQRENLIVITSGDELRLAGAAISRGFSWERTLTELYKELVNNAAFLPLLQCARYFIINFGCIGAVFFENDGSATPKAIIDNGKLVYDPTLAEGQWKHCMQDSRCRVYGVMNTFTASIAVHLLALYRDESAAPKPTAKPITEITDGIKRGLTGIRLLRLRGYGTEKDEPGFPFKNVAHVIRPQEWMMDPKELAVKQPSRAPSPLIFRGDPGANPPLAPDDERKQAAGRAHDETALVAEHGYQVIRVSSSDIKNNPATWTLVSLAETPFSPDQPLFGLAHSYALYGEKAICHIPHARFGELLSVDRTEIETLRSLRQLIEAFSRDEKTKRPLSLAAFGPPGSGKSFGIKQIANEILGKDGKGAEILEFNLSQYDNPNDLVGAFHQVRDKVLQGHLPAVFWDEFDSQGYKWLQFLLSPMQDGSFQSEQLTHPLGKCIFVFAGATSWDFENFGPVPRPRKVSTESATKQQSYEDPEVKRNDAALEADFKLKKGPDFISRLDGYINVLGPNPRMLYDYSERSWTRPDPKDITWPVRRAILLRSYLGVKNTDVLNIDRDLLRAFIMVPKYVYGARSLEKIARPLARSPKPFRKAYLPPPQVLEQHLDSIKRFDEIYNGNRLFREPEKLWQVAAAINENYLQLTDKKRRHLSRDEFVKALALEDAWGRATNLAAAARLPEVLAVAGLQIEEGSYKDPVERDRVGNHIMHPHNLHNMAKEEHNLWMAFHRENGWGYIDPKTLEHLSESDRKQEIKRLKKGERLHTLLIPFDDLPEKEKKKDYSTIEHYQDMADLIGHKITFMK